MKTAVVVLAIFCPSTFCQNVSVGIVAGTNVTNDVSTVVPVDQRNITPGATQTSIIDPGRRRLIIGLKLELRLPRNWALEVNALHRELKSTSTTIFSPPIDLGNGRQLAMLGPFTQALTSWEFPLLAKYRLPVPGLHPFLAVGPTFRPAGNGLSHTGLTAGGGLEIHSRSLNISPTLRYTRWVASSRYPIGGPLVDQVEILVAFDKPATKPGVSAFGIPLSMGVIAGIGLGSDFTIPANIANFTNTTSESNSGIYGVIVKAALPKDLAVEVDGLYRPLHGSHRERFAHLTWEFPVLLQYYFPTGKTWRPFVEAGPSFRAEGNLNLQPVSHYGGTVGAGIEWKISRIRISPTVRYSRWASKDGISVYRTAANQTHLLVSVAF